MERYNGWTNYETWNIALWIANDGLYDEPARIVREIASDHDQEYETADELADGIRDEVASAIESMCDETFFSTIPETGPAADMLNDARSRIDWHDIARHYIADEDLKEFLIVD